MYKRNSKHTVSLRKSIFSTVAAILLTASIIIPAHGAAYEKYELTTSSAERTTGGYIVISAKVSGGWKWGLLDRSGKQIVSPIYDHIGRVSEGMIAVAQVVDGDYKYGFIDTTGKVIAPLIYDYVGDFSDGMAVVSKKYRYYEADSFGGSYVTSSKSGFIDKSGKEVIPLIYDSVARAEASMPSFASLASSVRQYDLHGFSEGLACVYKDGKWGAIDKQGNTVIPFVFNNMAPFSDGMACVLKDRKYGYIDKSGKLVISCKYGLSNDFFEGLAVVSDAATGLRGAINKQGEVVVPMIYDSMSDFSEGMAVVSKKVYKENGAYDYKSGYVNSNGTLVVPMIYDEASIFSDGLARVGMATPAADSRFVCKCGFINKHGEVVIPLKYDTAGDFVDGLACVALNAGNLGVKYPGAPAYGFVDQSGKEVIPLSYYSARDFEAGIALARKSRNGNYSLLINPNYREVTSPETEPVSLAAANPTSSKVMVNGTEVSFDAYNINDNNYFKLRDLAQVLRGTEKQFEVTWDNDARAINMLSGKAYTSIGGEMAKGDGKAKTAQSNNAAIYLNGEPVELKAYNINGNNYFKLRDLGTAFDFDVSWDGANNMITIETAKSYTPD